MLRRRVILALTLALTWCWGAWHEDLEAAGWMFDHHHQHHHRHHETNQSGSHEHTPLCGDDHKPVWARDLSNDALFLPLLQFLPATLGLGSIWAPAFNLRMVDVPIRGGPKRPTLDLDSIWNFVRRCAPDVAAPPALS